MKSRKTCLVTGGAGYVGSTLIRELLASDYNVRCIDMLIYGDKALKGLSNNPRFEFIFGDIRDKKILNSCLKDVDFVIHLAAIVGDKPCQAAPESAYQINYFGTKILGELAKKSGVNKFIFASTCSNYGISDPNSYATEESKLNPVSLYAETKIDCEKFLSSISDEKFSVVNLRFGTAYGMSFRTRFDLTVNSFAYEALTDKKIVIFSADTWRPYVHVLDMSKIILKMLEIEKNKIKGTIFNAGFTNQNLTKRNIVEILEKIIPDLVIEYVPFSEDRRDYKVKFKKFEDLTKITNSKTVNEGYREILDAFKAKILTKKDYDSNNLKALTEFFSEKKFLFDR
tara:strand:+ start:932 stop:1954 length:1023 start_codon:yes stop_codon:yes gene_type:complete